MPDNTAHQAEDAEAGVDLQVVQDSVHRAFEAHHQVALPQANELDNAQASAHRKEAPKEVGARHEHVVDVAADGLGEAVLILARWSVSMERTKVSLYVRFC